MDFKSVLIFLGLWKSITAYCGLYSDHSAACVVTFECQGTTDIPHFHNIHLYSGCSEFKIRAIFRSVCQKNQNHTLFKCSGCRYKPNFSELEISDSACSLIPTFDEFPNTEVIRMHKTNLEYLSITSNDGLQKLRLLDLSQNKISTINTLELYSSRNLQVLDVSHNMIVTIKNQVFQHVSSLRKLDLASNRINNITSLIFYGLHNLNILYLSHNRISDINSVFTSLTELEEIYLDNNNLHEINENCFKGLKKLIILKLNSNFIIKFDWTTMEHILILEVFDISYNRIETVTKTAFAKNNNLNHINLSFNSIAQIVPFEFSANNISFFAMRNNSLKGGLEIGMFEGMKMVSKLDLSHQNIDTIGDHAFYGLNKLSALLLNYNKIENIYKKAFSSLLNLAILDLSNNMLHYINFNMQELTNLKNLQFENNLIADIETNSFMKMQSLVFLDLSQNNLTTFNSDTCGAILPHLKHLNISHNSLQMIHADIFDKFVNVENIDLSYNNNLTIAYNLTKLNLVTNSAAQPSSETRSFSITNCSINDVFFLKMNNFRNIHHLDFSHNKIPKIEYGMFSSNIKLMYLDLSFNKITHIQPGSFQDNNELKVLNVAHNELIELNYGSFFGLNHLETLHISFNKIKSLEGGMFYDTPKLNTLIVDNNTIKSVGYNDFEGAHLETLSIGGNPIPCSLLVILKRENHDLQLTALNKDHQSQSFNGIACDPGNHNNSKSNDNFLGQDALLEDIRNVLVEIKNKINVSYDKLFDPVSKRLQKSFYQFEAYEEDDARPHFDKLESDIGKFMPHTQNPKCIISDICLMFIAVVLLCALLYKVYELNLFRSLRRRWIGTASTQPFERQIRNRTTENELLLQFN